MTKKTNDSLHDQEYSYHVPVLLNEAIEALQIKPDGVYVDCTFGGGGHGMAILERLGSSGRLIAFDQDEAAAKNVPNDNRLIFVPHNFKHLSRFLRMHKHNEVDGIFADLGVSSHQFDEGSRGFSIRFDAALDMRMDQQQTLTAATILNSYSETALHKLFESYGEITNSKTLARAVVDKRAIARFTNIFGLKQSLHDFVIGNPNKYFAKLFQALRIEVNDEIGVLKEMLLQVTNSLKPSGIIAVISFHSLEDRIVKNFFKTGMMTDVEVDEIYGTKKNSPFKTLTKKPILASESEIKINSRSRSAKLRVAQKN